MSLAHLVTEDTVAISKFKISPTRLMAEAEGSPIAVMKDGEPAFYAVPPAIYESMVNQLEDLALGAMVDETLSRKYKPRPLNLNE